MQQHDKAGFFWLSTRVFKYGAHPSRNPVMPFLPTIAILSVFLWVAYRNATKKTGKQPPGPQGLPIFGSIFELDRQRPWHTFVEWKKEYGEVDRIQSSDPSLSLFR
jgi:hypothetical protein